LCTGKLVIAKVNALRELQSTSGEELSPLLQWGDASVLPPYELAERILAKGKQIATIVEEIKNLLGEKRRERLRASGWQSS